MSTAETLGLVVESESGDERICTCVACNKERHFYWNVEKEVGHCHHCDENFTREQLLEYLIADCQENISDELLQDLAEDRGLPVAAFESAGFGYVDGWYILPVWNTSISLASIRRYKIGGNFYIMGGCQAALFGAEELGDQSRTDEPVYLCEGEWDAIALGWFLSQSNERGIVVAAPGANTFKRFWPPLFRGRAVNICYDNDEPGHKGAATVQELLSPFARKLASINWGKNRPNGYDVRDWVREHVLQPAEKGKS
jgi:hypothetical protein